MMTRPAPRRHLNLFVVGLFLLFVPTSVLAEEQASDENPDHYIRVKKDANGEDAFLETAIVRFGSAGGEGGLVVDLIGAVHVADRSYYEKLNTLFRHYDVLLYELVAPKGTRVPLGGGSGQQNPLSFLQNMTTEMLDLDLQMSHIDYTAKNFVHADLSPDEMAKAIADRGDNGVTLFLSIASDMMREMNRQDRSQDEPSPADALAEIDLFSLFLQPDGDSSLKLKRVFARQFGGLSNGSGLGKTLETILVDDRNQAAMRVFQSEIAKGKKRIGIFYGAAHLADFEERLGKDFGLKRTKIFWLPAWDLRDHSPASGNGGKDW